MNDYCFTFAQIGTLAILFSNFVEESLIDKLQNEGIGQQSYSKHCQLNKRQSKKINRVLYFHEFECYSIWTSLLIGSLSSSRMFPDAIFFLYYITSIKSIYWLTISSN